MMVERSIRSDRDQGQDMSDSQIQGGKKRLSSCRRRLSRTRATVYIVRDTARKNKLSPARSVGSREGAARRGPLPRTAATLKADAALGAWLAQESIPEVREATSDNDA